MMQHSSLQKAQKGWLSRWTRKQWSRHWFVLKNGSLTYYRGPAAELCSFLDGVLDLSLIKHIEVPQVEESNSGNNNQQHQQQHSNHAGNQNSSSANAANQQQFTFSLKMWNGECHLLGASSLAERSLWLEAINGCTSADDDAATDSASSSDSSPTSHLSGGRHWNQRQQEQLALDQLALSLRSAVARRREQELVLDLAESKQQREQVEKVVEKPIRHSQQVQQVSKQQTQQQQQQLEQTPATQASQQQSSQEDQEQAFKRRLMCVQSNQVHVEGDPKLITRPLKSYAYLQAEKSRELDMNSASSSSSESESELDSDHDSDHDDHKAPAEPESRLGASELQPSSSSTTCQKQKKRVTFDLSLSSHHQLSSSGSSSSSSSSSDSDSSISSSDASSSSTSSSEDELDEAEQGAPVPDCAATADLIDLSQPITTTAAAPPVVEPATGAAEQRAPEGASEPMEVNHWRQSVELDGASGGELESKLERAQVSIEQLEAKLSSSYASHSQLELSYKRLQADLLKGDELHRLELARLEARVEELQRELAAGELKLAEAREKLMGYERRMGSGGATNRSQSPHARSMSLNNWLAKQQVVSAGGHKQQHLQQPLLLMHHVKHSLTANQQSLGLKLLNHSKQIQRKLNELELKVDKIQGAERGQSN